jgi:LysM repeat protein
MSPLTTFVLEEANVRADGPFARLKLEVGKLWIILNGGSLEVDTPSGVASVRGSYLHVWVLRETGETIITCLEGACELSNGSGSVQMTAGQSASVMNANTPPESGAMSHQDVEEWIKMNPEATLVVLPLTAVPGDGTLDGNTPTATTPGEPTATDVNCGPPDDWVPYTVKSGETLENLANRYRTTTADIQRANCLGGSNVVVTGQSIFVPNVATITPTNTKVAPTKTTTPTPRITTVPTPTKTSIPSNSNAVFSNATGPSGTLSQCSNFYSVNVSDPDGIQTVKVHYALNDAAKVDSTPSAFVLNAAGGTTYSANFVVDTSAVKGTDTVYFRFVVFDNAANQQVYPDTTATPFAFTDAMDCPIGAAGDNPASFSFESGPDGISISTCSNLYEVNVVDLDGVSAVWLLYSLNDSSFSSPQMLTMVHDAGDRYKLQTSISTLAKTGLDKVYWKFKAEDSNYNQYVSSTTHWYDDWLDCP